MKHFYIIASISVFISNITANNFNFPEIEGFRKEIRNDVYYPDNLYDLINGGSDVYLEYNFIDLHLCEYSIDSIVITVEVYNHGDLTNAFGIYSTERSPDYYMIDIGTEGYKDLGIINFFKNRYYIKISSYSEIIEDIEFRLDEVAQSIDKAIASDAIYPEIVNLFPDHGKINYTDHYISNSFLGYEFFRNIYTAKYNIDEEFTLFIIENENENMADEILKMYLEKKNIPVNKNKENLYEIDDKYNGTIYIKKSGNKLLGTIKCTNKDIAIDLISNIQE